ncbi:hypothetical protein PLEOSDRAFT_176457 [Pleurotus ostreatus PC15]|uniref:Uncharacterized protein n=1 Tax=Pleurotus ostreatus (strain PC15) TaxID=1137138 RepID=A0A067NH73_PLEO1|nr:hypothetical protein PLEOSDRAFT_176457 [Pleurotus ostreatus PC15]
MASSLVVGPNACLVLPDTLEISKLIIKVYWFTHSPFFSKISPLLAVSRLTIMHGGLNYDYLSHGAQQVPRALATQSPSEAFPMFVRGGQNMMLEDDTESTGGFAETVREIDEEFYRTFPAAMLPPIVPPSGEWVYDRTTGQYLHCSQVAVVIKDSDYPPCFSEDDSNPVVPLAQCAKQEYEYRESIPAGRPHSNCATPTSGLQHSHHVATPSNDSSLMKATYSYDTQPNKSAPVHESICASPAVAAVPPHLVVPSQQPTVDFSSEIKRQQQWGHGANMHNPYPQPVVKAEPSYASHSLLSQMPEIISPNSPDTPMTPVYTEQGIAMTVSDGHWKYHRYETCIDSSTPSDHGEAHPEWSQYEHGSATLASLDPTSPPFDSPASPTTSTFCHRSPVRSSSAYSRQATSRPYHPHHNRHRQSHHRLLGSPSRSRRSPSPRLETYPASSCSLEPEMSPAPLSPLSDEKPLEKKPPLACLFCRGRKIACGPPLPGSKDRTCKFPFSDRLALQTDSAVGLSHPNKL